MSYRSSESQLEEVDLLVGGSASPFIDEGDGFTGERERVWMFLCLVAYADEGSDDGRRPQSVDVTIECQVHMGGCVGFFRKGGC